ncbi:MAG TPA: hypothetical protein VGE68_00595 [Sphingomicrobium sp.]
MGGIDPYGVGSALALFLGSLLVFGGLRGRRQGYRQHLEGFAILATAVAAMGVLVLAYGFYNLVGG